MCTYNGDAYLKEQLDSILSQDYPLYEIIVQDDGSTDTTWNLLSNYASRYPLIHLYQNHGTHGINGNFFSALRRATGDYIAISDQDDIWEPNKISRQMAALGDRWLCGGFSKPFSSDGFPVKWDDRVPCLHLLRLCYLSEIPGHVQLLRRELLEDLPEEGTVPYLYDWQLQFMASAAEKLVFLPEVLVHFRRHAEAATATVPVSQHGGGLKTFWFLLRNYSALHQFAAERFAHIQVFLAHLQGLAACYHTESTRLVQELAALYQQEGLLAYLKMMVFCMRHHDKIYHASCLKRWKSVLRAAYFPLYSLNYYRGIIKSR